MYDRDYAGSTLNFEPSGGLMNASLVMQDKETDTYWSIMSGKAEAGELEGTALRELPFGKKVQWKNWVAEHPDTLVLSATIQGGQLIQDPGSDSYAGYWADSRGYNGTEAKDERLATKTPIYAFMRNEVKYAIPHDASADGATFELADGTAVFLFRGSSDQMFRGTAAFVSNRGFENRDGTWVELSSGAKFSIQDRVFSTDVEILNGFDTFWYTWSLTHPDTKLLR